MNDEEIYQRLVAGGMSPEEAKAAVARSKSVYAPGVVHETPQQALPDSKPETLSAATDQAAYQKTLGDEPVEGVEPGAPGGASVGGTIPYQQTGGMVTTGQSTTTTTHGRQGMTQAQVEKEYKSQENQLNEAAQTEQDIKAREMQVRSARVRQIEEEYEDAQGDVAGAVTVAKDDLDAFRAENKVRRQKLLDAEDRYLKLIEGYDGKAGIVKDNSIGSIFGKVWMSVGAGLLAGGGVQDPLQAINNLIQNDIEAQKSKIDMAGKAVDAESKVFDQIMKSHTDEQAATTTWVNLRLKQATEINTKLMELPIPMEQKEILAASNAAMIRERVKNRQMYLDNAHQKTTTQTTTTKMEKGLYDDQRIMNQAKAAAEASGMDPAQRKDFYGQAQNVAKSLMGLDRIMTTLSQGDGTALPNMAQSVRKFFDAEKWGKFELERRNLISQVKGSLGDFSALQKEDKKFFDWLESPPATATLEEYLRVVAHVKRIVRENWKQTSGINLMSPEQVNAHIEKLGASEPIL